MRTGSQGKLSSWPVSVLVGARATTARPQRAPFIGTRVDLALTER